MNNSAKLHHDPVWNDGALGFFEELPEQQEQREQDEYSDIYEISSWYKETGSK